MGKHKFKVGDRVIWIHPENDWGDIDTVEYYRNRVVKIVELIHTNSYTIKVDGELWSAYETGLKLYKPKLKKFLEEYRKKDCK